MMWILGVIALLLIGVALGPSQYVLDLEKSMEE